CRTCRLPWVFPSASWRLARGLADFGSAPMHTMMRSPWCETSPGSNVAWSLGSSLAIRSVGSIGLSFGAFVFVIVMIRLLGKKRWSAPMHGPAVQAVRDPILCLFAPGDLAGHAERIATGGRRIGEHDALSAVVELVERLPLAVAVVEAPVPLLSAGFAQVPLPAESLDQDAAGLFVGLGLDFVEEDELGIYDHVGRHEDPVKEVEVLDVVRAGRAGLAVQPAAEGAGFDVDGGLGDPVERCRGPDEVPYSIAIGLKDRQSPLRNRFLLDLHGTEMNRGNPGYFPPPIAAAHQGPVAKFAE